jgi:dihydrofolate synthase/folylpolyglutamate synthase
MSDPATPPNPPALEFLWQRINYERMSLIPYRSNGFKLERMRELLRRLGDPHHGLPVVHIAGTKGKGSTAGMIAAILHRAGYRVGLYTSPHLERLEERYRFQDREIERDSLVSLLEELRPHVEAMDSERLDDTLRGPTFFEITTALAFLYFRRERADFAVLEVGLGGRLDSTNICQPVVCAITSISFDHTRQLGNTLAAIAGEKAGIIKPGVPVISGVLPSEPREVIEATARAQEAPLRQCGEHFHTVAAEQERFHYHETLPTPWPILNNVSLNLRGEHQRANAGVAIAVAAELVRLGWHIDEASLRAGLQQVHCPGRLEFLRESPPVILDTAHNVASIFALCATLKTLPLARPRVLVFATSKDKDLPGMLRLLLPEFDHVVLTRYVNNPRAVSVEELRSQAERIVAEQHAASSGAALRVQLHTAEHPLAAWHHAQQLAPGDALLCVAGSFFLAAELRPVIQQALSDAPAHS